MRRVTGRGVLSAQDVTDALGEIRRHLLDADVSFEVTRGFVERVRERAIGAIAVNTVSPGQQVVKLVRDEIAGLSMTPQERADPSILTGSRRRRIAQGAGRPVQEVNRLLEQFQQMKKLLKRT